MTSTFSASTFPAAPGRDARSDRKPAGQRLVLRLRELGGGLCRGEGRRYAYETRCIHNPGRADAVFEAVVRTRHAGLVVARIETHSKKSAAAWCAEQHLVREAR